MDDEKRDEEIISENENPNEENTDNEFGETETDDAHSDYKPSRIISPVSSSTRGSAKTSSRVHPQPTQIPE